MLSLTASEENEISLYRTIFVNEYARDLMRNHQLSQPEAYKKASSLFSNAFPDHRPAKNNTLLSITNVLNGVSCHAGFLWLLYTPEEHSVFIMDFYINPEYRNKKIGHEALNNLMSQLEDRQITTVKLRVEPDNQVAIGLYKKMGFDITGINMTHRINPQGM